MGFLRALIPAAVAAIVVFPDSSAADSRNRYAPCCDSGVEYNWSGFFVGGHAAGALSQIDWAFTTPAEGTDHNERAFGGGVHAAFQRQWVARSQASKLPTRRLILNRPAPRWQHRALRFPAT